MMLMPLEIQRGPLEIQRERHPNENQAVHLPPEIANESGAATSGGEAEPRIGRDTAGEISFRFHDFSLPNNWV
uniref:Uncharacterized protein MANES_06G167900 n=1 Tax=Rhizophora mucronata TaxID=61149 RepID=A0A2P2JBK1_RHIMU